MTILELFEKVARESQAEITKHEVDQNALIELLGFMSENADQAFAAFRSPLIAKKEKGDLTETNIMIGALIQTVSTVTLLMILNSDKNDTPSLETASKNFEGMFYHGMLLVLSKCISILCDMKNKKTTTAPPAPDSLVL